MPPLRRFCDFLRSGSPRSLTALAAAAGIAGCAPLGYYAQLAHGQLQLLTRREPIERVVSDPKRDAELRRRLSIVLDARRFAIEKLGLPDNASYTLYADLGRRYAVWNVIATPEFSLEPITSCFPIVGCLSYRGFYAEADAKDYGERLRRKGYDVDLGGVPAYSTLGWFDDPVLNTMMRWSDAVLIDTVFHELAHQKLYVKSDTAFNESYATFVGDEGLREFLASRGLDDAHEAGARKRESQFTHLVLDARAKLAAIYSQPLSIEAMREAKKQVFDALRADYARLRDGEWGGDRRYDAWFAQDLNNATIAPFGLYDEWAPAFGELFAQSGGDWTAFHEASRKLGAEPPDPRHAKIQALLARAAPNAPSTAEPLPQPEPDPLR